MLNKQKIDFLAVLFLIFLSGSMFFMVQNMMPSMIVFLAIAVAYVYLNRTCSKKNFSVFLICIAILLSNMALKESYGISSKDFFIILLKLAILMIIQSNITHEKFTYIYERIMYFLAILSLACFIILNLGIGLPLTFIDNSTGTAFGYTFYHCMKEVSRNCGIFWEPGAYQIYLNYAIIFATVLFSNGKLDMTKFGIHVIVYIVAIITTQSSTGYLCMAVVLCYALFVFLDRRSNVNKLWPVFMAILALLIGVYIELQTGIIAHKLIDRGGSFNVRYNDTFAGLQLVMNDLWTGHGIFSTTSGAFFSTARIESISNGLVSMLFSMGLILTVAYFTMIFWGMIKYYSRNVFTAVFLVLFVLLVFNSESVYKVPFFMAYLFTWQDEDKFGIEKGIQSKPS